MSSQSPPDPLLRRIGERVAGLRRVRGLTRKVVAERSGLSLRFLAQVEAGQGNIAITRLARVCAALGTSLSGIVAAPESDAARRPVVALLGLRGAGKSTLGAAVATDLGLPFVEHDALVEDAAGMGLGELFALHGDAYYRRMSREVLERHLGDPASTGLLATSGGAVADPESLELLLAHCHTVWLRAAPEDHWERVVAQGDFRPMQDHADAMAALRRLLDLRRPLYARAEHQLDTSRLEEGESRERLAALIRALPSGDS